MMNSYPNLNRNRLLGSLGLCARARKIVRGDTLVHDIKGRKVFCVLIATDASERTKSDLRGLLKHQNLTDFEILDRDALSQAIGVHNTVAVGITDRDLSELVKKNIMG